MKWFLRFITCGVFLIACICGAGCADKPQESSGQTDEEVDSSEGLDKFSLQGYGEEGKKLWELEGNSAQILDDRICLDLVESNVFRGNRIVSFSSEKGIFKPESKMLELNTDVVVRIGGREDREVAEEPTVITCSGPLNVNYERNVAVFNDDVEVSDTRGTIYCDKLRMYFASTKDISPTEKDEAQLQKLIATGNVEIHRGENVSYSQKAIYITQTGSLTLIGAPELVVQSADDFKELMPAEEGREE